jgi:hypothetical protein
MPALVACPEQENLCVKSLHDSTHYRESPENDAYLCINDFATAPMFDRESLPFIT